jgi:hypothetical protein
MKTIAELLRNSSRQASQLAEARAEYERLLGESDRIDNEIAEAYKAASASVAAGDVATDQAVRAIDRLKLQQVVVHQQLGEASALIALLEDPATIEALNRRDQQAEDAVGAQIRHLECCEEHLRLAALAYKRAGIPARLWEPVLRGITQRLLDRMGQSIPGVGTVSPGVQARGDQSLAEIFLGAKPKDQEPEDRVA